MQLALFSYELATYVSLLYYWANLTFLSPSVPFLRENICIFLEGKEI